MPWRKQNNCHPVGRINQLINAQGRERQCQDGDGQDQNGHQNPVRNPREVAYEQLAEEARAAAWGSITSGRSSIHCGKRYIMNLTYSNILILRMAQLLRWNACMRNLWNAVTQGKLWEAKAYLCLGNRVCRLILCFNYISH